MATDVTIMINTSTIIEMKEPIKEPEMRSQKLLYCWQIGSQLAPVFPLCATATIAAAAEAAAVSRAIIT